MDEKIFSEDKLYTLFQEWFFNRSPEEFKLYSTILDYGESYFEDMTFQENSLCWNIYSFIVENFEELYLDLSSSKWMYRFLIVEDTPEFLGQCNSLERTISITQSHINDKKTILHEMIHAYENILDSVGYSVLRENLLIALYRKLLPKISDLEQRIADHSELYSQTNVMNSGGKHDLLFFLKSLDLDIRCGYDLGTVCGYGRDTGDMWY